jgi:hypothetical protein
VVGGTQNVIVIAGNKYNTDAQSSARVDTELGPSKKHLGRITPHYSRHSIPQNFLQLQELVRWTLDLLLHSLPPATIISLTTSYISRLLEEQSHVKQGPIRRRSQVHCLHCLPRLSTRRWLVVVQCTLERRRWTFRTRPRSTLPSIT